MVLLLAPVLAGIRNPAAESQPEYFPLYLMKYTDFSSPDGVFLVLLSFFFFLTFLFLPGILFIASDRQVL